MMWPGIQSSAEFLAGFKPPDYLVDGLLQRGFCYSMTGQTGAGKTAIALLLAAHVALGWPLNGREIARGPVLYFAGENQDDIRMRWMAMAEHRGFNPDTIEVYFIPGVFKISELRARIQEEIQRLGGIALAIIDTSAAYYPGTEENDNVQMGAHARVLRSLTDLPGRPTVLPLCHPVKNAANDNLLPRGGGAFIAEMDGNLVCFKTDSMTTLHWQGKFRGPDFESIPFELCPVTAEKLKDSRGRPIPTVIAKPLDDKRQADLEAKSRRDEDAVLVVISENEGLSVAGIAEQLNWLAKGKPHKSKVQRVIQRLRTDKLVANGRGTATLTERGEKAAKTAKTASYNRDMTGERYG